MHCSIGGVRLSNSLVYTVCALFIIATVWPTERSSNTYGVELQPADTVNAVFQGVVVENDKSDSLKAVKAKGSNTLVKIAIAVGVIGAVAAAYLLVSGGKERQVVPADTTGGR